MPPDYQIAVVARTLDVLEMLAVSDEPVALTELARDLDATKSSVFRILVTLEQRGYVAREPSSGRYRLGTHLAYLGSRSLRSLDLRRAARPVLEELHRRFGETVNLGVLDDAEVVYIDMVESDHGLRMAAQLGGRDPAYSTSLGKAILAYLPEPVRESHLPTRLIARTPQTIINRALLAVELERIRREGVAEDVGENEAGAHCFGAPIFDHGGSVIAAISISAPESRLSEPLKREIAPAIADAAGAITGAIGGRIPKAQAAVGVADVAGGR